MRKFFLRNESGTDTRVYQLQYTDAFLWQPAGLGFSYNREYAETDGFFLELSSAINQTDKTGTLVFHGADPYKDYTDFINWIFAGEKLKLAYTTDDVNWFYMDIDVNQVEKSELQMDGTLQCAIVMTPKTPIYIVDYKNVEINGELPTSMKKYTYGYKPDLTVYDPYLGNSSTPITNGGAEAPTIDGEVISPNAGDYVTYGGTLYICDGMNWATVTSDEKDFWYTYSDTAVAGEIVINTDAQLPCGIEVFTENPVSGPTLTFYDGAKAIGKIDLSAVSVAADEKLLYSGIPTSAGVIKTAADGTETDITNLLGLDAAVPSFFMIPPKKNITAVLSADSLAGVKIEIRVYRYFASV